MGERIAVVSTSYPRAAGDAAGHFVAAEVKRLVRAGNEVHVFAPGAGETTRDDARLHWFLDYGAFGFPGALPRLRDNPLRLMGAAHFALRAAHALGASAPFTRVQAHFLLPSAWPIVALCGRAQRLAELELVGHGSDVRLFCRLPALLRRRIARRWLHHGARVRVTSRELAELLGRASPELSCAIYVAPSPIDVDDVPSRAAARARLGLDADANLAVIVARLVPGKRVDVALRALALLEDLRVIVIGDGPELSALRAAFPRARFTGQLPRPEALAFIAAANVLVSASAHEGAPSVVREARALGVPVVAVAAGDLTAWAETDLGLLVARA